MCGHITYRVPPVSDFWSHGVNNIDSGNIKWKAPSPYTIDRPKMDFKNNRYRFYYSCGACESYKPYWFFEMTTYKALDAYNLLPVSKTIYRDPHGPS